MILWANTSSLTESELHILIEVLKAIGALVVFIIVLVRRKKRMKKEAEEKKRIEELERRLKEYEDNSKQ